MGPLIWTIEHTRHCFNVEGKGNKYILRPLVIFIEGAAKPQGSLIKLRVAIRLCDDRSRGRGLVPAAPHKSSLP